MSTIEVSQSEIVWEHIEAIGRGIELSLRKESEGGLYRGVAYLQLSLIFKEYKKICRREGHKPKTYEEYRVDNGYKWDSKGNISVLTQIARRYILEYGMGACSEATGLLDRVDPVLLNMPTYLLYKLLKYHASPAAATEILYQAGTLSRVQFILWLATYTGYEKEEIAKHLGDSINAPNLNLDDPDADLDENQQKVIRVPFVHRQIIDTVIPGATWNDYLSGITLPNDAIGFAISIEEITNHV